MELVEVASQPEAVQRSISEFVHSLAEAVIIVLVVCLLLPGPAHGHGGGPVDSAGAGG
jgi:multidrug efflux pump